MHSGIGVYMLPPFHCYVPLVKRPAHLVLPISPKKFTDQYNSRIKFAPLPAKSLASSTAKPLTSSTAKRSSTSNTTSNSSSELLETQNSHVSKQGSMRKKSAWIHRWLLPVSFLFFFFPFLHFVANNPW
jgi:hypothetical protein